MLLPLFTYAQSGNSTDGVSSEFFDVIFTETAYSTWDDRGSGADRDVTFWQPVAKPGYFVFGDMVTDKYMSRIYTASNGGSYASLSADDKKLMPFTIALRPKPGYENLLKVPTGFQEVWNDAGSGANRDGRVFRILCPGTSVALGMIATNGSSPEPRKNDCRCIEKTAFSKTKNKTVQLIMPAAPQSIAPTGIRAYWDDAGSGADRDIAVFQIGVKQGIKGGQDELVIPPSTFLASNSGSRFPDDKAYALVLQFQTDLTQPVELPTFPELTGPQPINFGSNFVTTNTYQVPCFSVVDNSYNSLLEQFRESPVYTVHRTTRYELVDQSTTGQNTDGVLTFAYTVGITNEENHAASLGLTRGFSVTAGVSGGVPGVGEASVEVTSSIEISASYSWGGSVATTEEKTYGAELPLRPYQTYGAIYQAIDDYVIKRKDGTEVGGANFRNGSKNYHLVAWPSQDPNAAKPAPAAPIAGRATPAIPGGTTLEVGKQYFSPNRQYYMIHQPDGNFVIYNSSNNHFVWGSYNNLGAPLDPAGRYVMQSDGNLSFLNPNNEQLWSTRTRVAGSGLQLSDNGKLEIVSPANQVIWRTN
ncbi:hypothetical protein GGR26_003083 [Lewinella marina]|nr:hypothetical protein [Neolewinella marina]NJB87303.1 hypothetical protein [Neolewinella marina]